MGCCDSSKKVNSTDKNFSCPVCDSKGANVGIETLKSLLLNDSKNTLRESEIYKYCKTPDCEVTYFCADKNHFFKANNLKVKATVKDNGLDVHVCYCFDYTRQSILDEINKTGDTGALEDIKAKMKSPGCFCEISNPQGGCCLGNVTAWIKEAKLFKE